MQNGQRRSYRAELLESFVLFLSVVKWFIIATIVGSAVGFAIAGFLRTLEISTLYMTGIPYYYLLLPLGMFLSSLMTKYLARDAEGHGTEKVIEAIHRRAGRIKLPVIPVKFLATVVTIAFGGSVGKEGPAAQIGGGISSVLADLFRFEDRDRRRLVICGISAGFSSVFGTPIAGAIFGIEVLYIGNLFYEALFPSFVAGMISYHVTTLLGIEYYHRTIELAPVFSGSMLLQVLSVGIFLGITSFVFIETMEGIERIVKRIDWWKPLKAVAGGLLLVILTLLFSDRYLGLGLETITECLNGHTVPWYSFLIKMVFTSATLAFGGSGGIVTPIFFIGATAGSFFASLTGLDTATYAAIGLVGLLAGATNAPIAASIMAVELFGAQIAPYAAMVCIISYLITGHRSVYPSQVIARTKSPSIYIEPGKVLEEIDHIEIKARQRTFYGLLIKLIEYLNQLTGRLLRKLKDKMRNQ
ncbi:MAG: voltage-gated chloride channel [Nitrospirae bacterium]|nr:MAG: voltage-gated chloride channel [Nitrospirota bacterium]